MYSLVKKMLFRMDPEHAHELTIRGLQIFQQTPFIPKISQKIMSIENPRLNSTFWNLSFPNPVGLAAGFDKHANAYIGMAHLGFGFVEVGTLTPRPQPGNAKPRLFRLPEDQSVINRMGFNNHGAENAVHSFRKLGRPSIPIGINIGKNKDTPNEQASHDYVKALTTLYPYGDYFVINISSPNTQGLRDLQQVETLKELLVTIKTARDELHDEYTGHKPPILLKIAPDLSISQLQDIVHTTLQIGIEGIIATNTTLSREGLINQVYSNETGGLSGRPLTTPSTQFIQEIYQITQGQIPIIGVGGIFSAEDAYAKIRAGANLIQVYTGMIYEGPMICKRINQGLLDYLDQDGFDHIQDAVGQ